MDNSERVIVDLADEEIIMSWIPIEEWLKSGENSDGYYFVNIKPDKRGVYIDWWDCDRKMWDRWNIKYITHVMSIEYPEPPEGL